MRTTVLLILVTLFMLPLAERSAAQEQSLDGYWLSDGYGYLAEIKGGEMKLFEVTRLSCLLSENFTLKAKPIDPRGTRFVTKDSDEIFLTPGPSPDSEWVHDPSAASKILFRRASARPETCTRQTPNDPVTNFEVFAETFAAHHGFLKHRGVDWATVTRTYRAKVNVQTKPEELFEFFKTMIDPLHDAHTFVDAPGTKLGFGGKKPGTLAMSDKDGERTIEILETRYLMGKLRSWCRGHVRYARLKGGLGYLRIDAFADYTKSDNFDEGAHALATALDVIIQDAHALRGLVIDVRINGGGADPYGVQVAERFTNQSYVAFVKRARNDAQNPESWTPPQTATVGVSNRPRFLKPIVELISGDTVSAGETFTMALMGREPRITRIGEDTQGVFSDVLERRLPNGWRLGLPNEVFLTGQGTHFEARGVPPDIRIPVFPKADLKNGRDSALEKAIEMLSGRNVSLKRFENRYVH
jgi:hypothetical protein